MTGKKGLPIGGIATGAVIAVAVVAGVLAVVLTDTTGRRGSGLGEAYEYDYSEHREVDTGLLRYRETGRIETGFAEARGVAVGRGATGASGGEEFVYVVGDKAIRVFDMDGGKRGETALDGEPRCLAVGGDGLVYVGMSDHVEVYASPVTGEGEREARWEGFGAKAIVTSVAVSGGNVFVADAGNRIVHRLDAAGKLTDRIGAKDEARGIPGLAVYKPCLDLLAAADGSLRVVNPGRHRIETYTPDGELVSAWGKGSIKIDGFAGCCNPANIALLPDGRTVTAEKGMGFRRVKVYDGAGELEAVVAGPKQFEDAELPLDVAVDSKGRVLVLDPAAGAVRAFKER